MLEYVGSRAEGLRERRERADVATLVRRLDWLLIAGVGALVGYGLWAIAGITQHDVLGNPNYYVIRQGVYAAVGGVGLLIATLVDPEDYRRHWRALYVAAGGSMLLVI